METLAPFHKVTLHEASCEVHSRIDGFWTKESIQTYFDDVNAACLPLVKSRSPIYALVDMSELVPQDRATSEAIRDHLMLSKQFGLKRLAVIAKSTLVKMQYRRLSEGLDVEFFDDRASAAKWLKDR